MNQPGTAPNSSSAISSWWWYDALALALATLGLACDAMPAMTCDDRSDVQAVDINGDGRPDVRIARHLGRELCRETDLNFDGPPDVIRVTSADGSPLWIGHDFDGDGRADQVEIHVVGRFRYMLRDLDGDGRPDLRQLHDDGRVNEEQAPPRQ